MTAKGNSVHVNQHYEPEAKVRDVFYHFLYRWRSILAVTVICALVLGGWQYLKVKKLHDAGELTNDERRYEAEKLTFDTNLQDETENVASLRSQIANKKAYREGSLMLALDPGKVGIAEKKYLVTDAEGNAADILAVYTGAMETDHDGAELQDAFGTDNAGYAKEMVTIEAVPGENAFRVTVKAGTEEAAGKGMAYVAEKIAKAGEKAQEVGKHSLQIADEGISTQAIPELMGKANALYIEIVNLETSLRIRERMLNNVIESEPAAPGDPVKRWAIAGGVFGLLGMLAVYLTSYLMRGKLRQGYEISEHYGAAVLGEMNRSGARRSGKGIDGWIEKRQFRKDPKTDDAVYDNAAALIREKHGEGTLLLAGTAGAETLGKVKEALAKRLDGIEIAVQANFPAESGGAESAIGAGSVVWVEEKHRSRNEKIKRAGEVFETAGAKVIGALVV